MRRTNLPAGSVQGVKDLPKEHAGSDGQSTGFFVDADGVELAQVNGHAALHLAQRGGISMTAAGGEKGQAVLLCCFDLRLMLVSKGQGSGFLNFGKVTAVTTSASMAGEMATLYVGGL